MHQKAMAAMSLASLSLAFTSPAGAQTQPINLNAGLQAQVLLVGRDKNFSSLTLSMTLINKGKNTVYLLFLRASGDPHAVDNTGASFYYQDSSGVPVCPSQNTPECIGVPEIKFYTPPLQNWMELDPGTSPVTLEVHLSSFPGQSHGTLVSFSCTFAYRVVSNLVHDETLTEKQKRDGIHLMNCGFPPTQVTQEQ